MASIGEVFGAQAAAYLTDVGLPPGAAISLGYGAVAIAVTYFSVIIGELVPKNLALRNAESVACAVAPIMVVVSKIAGPAVWLLDASTRLVFRAVGLSTEREVRVTDEEIKALIAEAERAGVLETSEREMLSGVMRLADRTVVGLMTPRTDVDWIDITASQEEIKERLISTPHSRLPVGEGSIDSMIGVIQTRELLATLLSGKPFDVRSLVRKAPIIPEGTDALDALATLREAEVPMALIHDEYGNFQGLVTSADVLEAIAGAFRSDTAGAGPMAVEREDGSWLLSGAMPADEMADKLGIKLPEKRAYETVAGFVLAGSAAPARDWRVH